MTGAISQNWKIAITTYEGVRGVQTVLKKEKAP
jgi:hypothetical protein